MRNPKYLSLSILCAAVLGGCGGGSDPGAAQAGADTLAGADLKSRRDYSEERSSGSGSGTSGPTAPATGEPVGRLLASNCFNCHGTDGRPSGGFDQLAGESASEIVKELKEMAAKTEEGGIMRIHAMGYTDEQLRQLGTYFASQR